MSSTDNIITLKSSDGESFEVKKAVARRSLTISHLIDGGIPDDGIPLREVTGKILSKVIEYCKMHVCDIDRDYSVAGDDLEAWDAGVDQDDLLNLSWEPAVDGVDLKAWDAEFVKVDGTTLRGISKAARDLKIKGLVDLTTDAVLERMRGKTAEEIRKGLDIKNDFTPEEEEEIRRENQWESE